MNRLLLAGTLAGIFAAGLSGATDASETVRASCHQDGRIVYREDFPSDAPAEKRILIAARHPGAMCVFLDVPGGAAAKSNPVAVTEPFERQRTSGDDDLAAALAVIAEGRPGDRYPPSIADAVKEAAAPQAQEEGGKEGARPGFLNLTIGIYRDVPLADVMEHWKAMQDGTKVLSHMTPTVNALDGVIVVSVEGVPDDLAGTLCEEAAAKGAGCVAVY